MTRRKAFLTGELYGMMVALCCVLLYQDFLGKEGYIKNVERNWIDLPWMLCAVVLVFLLTLAGNTALRAKELDKGDGDA